MMQDKFTSLVYDARDEQLFRIWIVNLLLKIVTLGIYGLWGKTRFRRYVVSSFSLLGDRFEYSGTGGELFRGFLKALPIIVVLYAPLYFWNQKQHPLVGLMFIPIMYFYSAAVYAALRYRFSRTTWRGIRGHLTGSAFGYAGLALWRTMLNIFTLGILIPFSDIYLKKYQIDHTYFGSAKAEFNANPLKLMGVHIVTLLLAIPTLGISRFWYRAALLRYEYESLFIGMLRFKGSQTGGNLLGLVAGNLLLLMISAGLAFPIIIQRNMRYIADNLVIVGDIATSGIHQSDEVLGNSGEGLYGLLGDQDIGLL